MKIQRDLDNVHPLLIEIVSRIQTDVIAKHDAPFKLFETSRDRERHNSLLHKGKTKDFVSMHLYDLSNDPPLYCTALDYVYYDGKWSWNLRNSTILSWYVLFGHLVLDICPELQWGGMSRKSINYNHFQLRDAVIIDHLDKYPCVTK